MANERLLSNKISGNQINKMTCMSKKACDDEVVALEFQTWFLLPKYLLLNELQKSTKRNQYNASHQALYCFLQCPSSSP